MELCLYQLMEQEGGVVHCNENPIYVFLKKDLRGFSPNFHIHVSVSDLHLYSHHRSAYSVA
jgi:hypothetical protein